MAVAVIVIVVGLIVGVALELILSRRQRARRVIVFDIDPETIQPTAPQLPQPRFIDDGEGFRILGPVEYDEPELEEEPDPDSDLETGEGHPSLGDR